jgi:hypothetical protein
LIASLALPSLRIVLVKLTDVFAYAVAIDCTSSSKLGGVPAPGLPAGPISTFASVPTVTGALFDVTTVGSGVTPLLSTYASAAVLFNTPGVMPTGTVTWYEKPYA